VQEIVENVKPDPKTATQREKSSLDSSKQSTADGGGQPLGTASLGTDLPAAIVGDADHDRLGAFLTGNLDNSLCVLGA